MRFFANFFVKKQTIDEIKVDEDLNKNRNEKLIFNERFILVTEQTDFRMAIWINGFGIINGRTREEILPIMHSFNLDHYEENNEILYVTFRIYPDGLKDYHVKINPFEKTFMHNSTSHYLSSFEDYFYKIAGRERF